MSLDIITCTSKTSVTLKFTEPQHVLDALTVCIVGRLEHVVQSVSASRIVLACACTSERQGNDIP